MCYCKCMPVIFEKSSRPSVCVWELIKIQGIMLKHNLYARKRSLHVWSQKLSYNSLMFMFGSIKYDYGASVYSLPECS